MSVLRQSRRIAQRFRRPQLESLETRLAPATVLANLPATDVTLTTATIGVEVVEVDSFNPNITLYWGDDDAGTNSDNWDQLVRLGPQSVGKYTTPLTNLNVATRYFYRAFAFSLSGATWASETASFSTLPPALADVVLSPVTIVGGTQAQITGTVADTGGHTPMVTIYYGPSDGGTDPAAWLGSLSLNEQTGEFATLISDLVPGTHYFARLAAVNAAGTRWSELTATFTTDSIPLLRISEFMAANASTLTSRTRLSTQASFTGPQEPYDWIEIQNVASSPADLGGYFLTDDPNLPTKWRIPDNTSIPAHGAIVVFASGLDLSDPALDEKNLLHTNFALAREGEYLALADPQGRVVHQFRSYPRQTTDVAYGYFGSHLGALSTPTPGQPNLPLAPQITAVAHRFQFEDPSQSPLVVTARVDQALSGITGVSLNYRVMFDAEQMLPMADDGSGADLQARDGIYTAVIPGGLARPGQMLRYYVTAVDELGFSQREPRFVNPTNSPEYYGTMIPDPSIPTRLPVLHRFIEQPRQADTGRGTRASLYYDGEFYDNVFVRIRGGTARDWPKKSYKIEFNDDHQFRFRSDVPRVDEININATYTDKSYVRSVLTAEFQNDAGTPSPESFLLRMHQNGEFFSVAIFVEQPDPDFLRRHGMDPDGALYKGGPGSTYAGGVGSFEKKTRKHEDKSDLQALLTGLRLTGDDSERFLFDHIDIPAQVNFMATNIITQNIDASDKNHYLYRDTSGTGEWHMMPWDLDLTFGPDALNTDYIAADEITRGATYPTASHPLLGSRRYTLHAGKFNDLLDRMITNSRTREMLLARVRTLADQFLAAGYFENRIDQLVSLIAPDVQEDKDKWRGNAHFGSRDYTLIDATDRIKDEYLARRLPFLTVRQPELTERQGGVGIPSSQPPDAVIRFGDAIEFNPPGGNRQEEYFTLVNTNPFAVDVSGWTISGATSATLAAGTVIPAGGTLYMAVNVAAFRARQTGPAGGQGLFVQSYDTELPNTGGTLVLTNAGGIEINRTEFGSIIQPASAANLRISEVNYNPIDGMPQFQELAAGGSQFEYLELTNVGSSTIELAGVRFVDVPVDGNSEGIQFTFASQTLEPGEHIVVVKNRAAFQSRYGSQVRIADGTGGNDPVRGQFAGQLSNGGERLTLLDASNQLIQQFTYADRLPWPRLADGNGASLEVIDPRGEYNSPANWRASSEFGGSPGISGSGPAIDVVINEVLASSNAPRGDRIELYNTTGMPKDLTGWYLTDSNNSLQKFRIDGPASVITAGAYQVFDETQLRFGLKGQTGDNVWLIEADAQGRPVRIADFVEFDATPAGVSVGRWPDGTGKVVPLSSATFGAPNSPPQNGALGDFNGDQTVNLLDVDLIRQAIQHGTTDSQLDLTSDGLVNLDDLTFLIRDVMGTVFGDTNLDGVFDSGDLVLIFQAGEYEDNVTGNSTWSEGDWNADGEFDTKDLILAFRSGGLAAR